MSTFNIDDFVDGHNNLAPLTTDSAPRFVEQSNAFFERYGRGVVYFKRNPNRSPTNWDVTHDIDLLGIRPDPNEVYQILIDYRHPRRGTDCIGINLDPKNPPVGYVFVTRGNKEEGVGLHLQYRNGLCVRNQALILFTVL